MLDGKVVLITGAGGSIGKALLAEVVRQHNPTKLLLVDISEFNLYEAEKLISSIDPHCKIEMLLTDIRHASVVNHIFATHRPDFVYHAAALKHVPMLEIPHNSIEGIRTNILGTKNVLEAALLHGAEQFLLVSSDKAVNPTNLMGATKKFAEGLVQEMGAWSGRTPTVVVRFGNVINSAGSALPLFRKQISNGGPVTLTHPDIERYFMSIDEAVRLILEASRYVYRRQLQEDTTFLLDMGAPRRVKDVIEELFVEMGKTVPVEVIGLRDGEKLYEELTYSYEEQTTTDVQKLLRLKNRGVPSVGFVETASLLFQTCDYRDLNTALSAIRTLVAYT